MIKKASFSEKKNRLNFVSFNYKQTYGIKRNNRQANLANN